MDPNLRQRATIIRLAVFDVDGVFTDGKLYFSEDRHESRAFDVKDGHGIRLLLNHGVEVAVVSGRNSDAVVWRMSDLGVTRVYQGVKDKGPVFEQLLEDCGIAAQLSSYMGDDLPDLVPMRRAGLACAVADACPEVIKCADWVARSPGGCGAVRELCDFLLRQQDEVIKHCST